MGIHHNLPHWNYYLLLEKDLEKCFQFVPPIQSHWGVYSDAFARIILMASSEIENALNDFAFWTQTKPKPSSINKYYTCVTSKYPNFCAMETVIPRYSIGFKPWDGWSAYAAPDWWSFGYNKIKHDRMKHPNAPTLIRAIKSVSSLQVLLLHYYRQRYKNCELSFDTQPKLIIPWEKDTDWLGATMSWTWKLPDEPKS